MTKSPETQVEQVDREAAAAYYYSAGGSPKIAREIREGKKDDWFRVQAFARHRLQALSARQTGDVQSDWFAGNVDADGNELITVRKDEWDRFKALENGPPYASDSWADHGYSSPAEEINDMANVGRSLLDRIASVVCSPGPFKGWSPMDDPAEIVTDLANALDAALQEPSK